MASIQSLGIGSGLLTSELIDKIVASERDATDARMTAKKAEIDAKVSAYGAVKNTIDALRTKAKALGDASTLLINTATSSDPAAVERNRDEQARAAACTPSKSAHCARAHDREPPIRRHHLGRRQRYADDPLRHHDVQRAPETTSRSRPMRTARR